MFVKPHPEAVVTLGHTPAADGKSEPQPVTIPVDVIHPHTRRPIPREGVEVPEDPYWMRRLRDGDLVLAERPPPVSEVAADREAQDGDTTEALPPPAPGTVAQVAFMLTAADKAALLGLGYSPDQVAHFTPDEGKRLIKGGVQAPVELAHEEPAR